MDRKFPLGRIPQMAVCFKQCLESTNMFTRRLHGIFKFLILNEQSSIKLARSFCVGIYIAFSPFIFFHTIMKVAASWIFRLNMATVFASSCLINNPWTMIPVYTGGYFFGEFVLGTLCKLDTMSYNPNWMTGVNEILATYIGLPKIAFWSFLVGGNLLGIICALVFYPTMCNLFSKMLGETGAP